MSPGKSTDSASQIPDRENGALYVLVGASGLIFLCVDICLLGLADQMHSSGLQLILWILCALEIGVLFLPLLWLAMVWGGRFSQRMFETVISVVGLLIWCANLILIPIIYYQ